VITNNQERNLEYSPFILKTPLNKRMPRNIVRKRHAMKLYAVIKTP